MTFVPYGTTWPMLNAYELMFRGLVFGGVESNWNSYQLGAGGIDGLGATKIVGGDVQRALASGEFAGVDIAGGRDLMFTVNTNGERANDLDAAIATLGAVMTPQGNVESPLFFRKGGDTVFGVMVRPRNFAYKADEGVIQAFGATATMQFHATDWRIYTATRQATVAISSVMASLDIANVGTAPTNPLILAAGGTDQCALLIGSADESVVLDMTSLGMYAGDTLSIDTDTESVIYTPTGGPPQKAKSSLAFTPPAWGPVGPNQTTTFEFTNNLSGTGWIVTVQWADAYASV